MSLFSCQDLEQIRGLGLSSDELNRQLEIFQRGTSYLKLLRPCIPADGLHRLNPNQIARCQARFGRAQKEGRVSKFVPASGAATRMFKDLYTALEHLKAGKTIESPAFRTFCGRFGEFAFMDEVRDCLVERGHDLGKLLEEGDFLPILAAMLDEDGLSYGQTPKGLLPFHLDARGPRTPIEEHFREAEAYTLDQEGQARLHFTVSEEHLDRFKVFVEKVRGRYERPGFRPRINFSLQKKSTNTLAVDLGNRPFRDDRGRLVFRPGGHGALIENLNDLEADIVFIKNIDNVVPERLRADTVLYKKALGGYLIHLQDRIFDHLAWLDTHMLTRTKRDEILTFLAADLGLNLREELAAPSLSRAREVLFNLLNRPLRVCGMVRNEGEPGGGPFWVHDGERESPQVVEPSQVNRTSKEQRTIWQAATHFNPVDLVCGPRDFKNRPFDLRKFVDPETFFISQKSLQGKSIKALERPGLWNGAMARWNMVFIEVPETTFTPVKTVNDLLRPEHH